MGQGGFIVLINSTNSDWVRIYQHSYQMPSWNFPERIPKMSLANVYIEYSQGIFKVVSDDQGWVNYQLEGTDNVFQVHSGWHSRANLYVELLKMKTRDNPQGSRIQLGWAHDGHVTFILAGANGDYTGTGMDSANWMQKNLALIGNKTLKEICIPGSHDAGMSKKTGGTAFGHECNTLTQSKDIKGQLELGARYFDIRPVISGGKYKTGHYGYVDKISSWQGANGQTMEEIINNINEFTSSHKELIILKLSHSLNTDVGNSSYRKFNDDEWDGLLKQMMKINNRLEGNHDSLIKIKIDNMIANQSGVIILIDGANAAILNKFNGKGFFPDSSLKIYDDYSGTDSVDHMVNDQIKKLGNHSSTDELFLLSWTLTQNGNEATFCSTFLPGKTIKDLARKAHDVLGQKVYPQILNKHYPNIIHIDDITDDQAVALSVACIITRYMGQLHPQKAANPAIEALKRNLNDEENVFVRIRNTICCFKY